MKMYITFFTTKMKSILAILFIFIFSISVLGQSPTMEFSVFKTMQYSPFGIATDDAGNVYVTERSAFAKHRVVKIDATTQVSTIVKEMDAMGGSSPINHLELDVNNNIFIANGSTYLRKIASNGTETNYATIPYSYGIDIDKVGNLYVSESNKKTINKVTAANTFRTIGTYTVIPEGMVLDKTETFLYVCFSGEAAIKKIKVSDGSIVKTYTGSFNTPTDVTLGLDGNIYAVDLDGFYLMKIDTSTDVVSIINLVANFTGPTALAVDKNGYIYVADYYGGKVYKSKTSILNTTTPSEMHLKIKVFPNPAIDFVKITNIKKGAEISLFDLTGKLLYETKSTEGSVIIDVSTFKNGIYILKTLDQTTKLIISKK